MYAVFMAPHEAARIGPRFIAGGRGYLIFPSLGSMDDGHAVVLPMDSVLKYIESKEDE